MKKRIIYSLLTVFVAFSVFSQENKNSTVVEIMDPSHSGKIFRNSRNSGEKILGTPYFQLMFASAKVENVPQKYFMRYNVFDDQFEFITPKNDTLILDKIDAFNNIAFTGTNKKYTLLNYTNSVEKLVKGYLIEVHSKTGYILYKKENVTFYKGKVAQTSLEKSMPPRYVKADDSYYFKNKEAGIIEFPENKKQLIKLFPDKKQEIEAYVKENKIDFDEENNKKRIIDFLSTL